MLRLAPYLVHKGYFEEVGFIFLVAGHTKNSADRLFNLLKINYQSENNYCMSQLLQSCSKNGNVNAIAIKWTDFYDWESFLLTLYKPKLKAIKVYQSFTSSVGIGDGIIQCKASNIPNCVEFNDAMNLRLTPEAQHAAMVRYPVHLYTTQPGLNPSKKLACTRILDH